MGKSAMGCGKNGFFPGGAAGLCHAILSVFDYNTQRVEQTKCSTLCRNYSSELAGFRGDPHDEGILTV